MKVNAAGTGLVARAAIVVLRDHRSVIGLDPSSGMSGEARKTLPIPLVLGIAKKLPFGNDRFDFLSMGLFAPSRPLIMRVFTGSGYAQLLTT